MAGRRILLTGASGLLGTWLRRTVPVDVDIVSLAHRHPVDGPIVRADLQSPDRVWAAVAAADPATVVHTAYANDQASIVDATDHVCAAAASHGAEVVLTSTDAVFSGDGRPRDEAADPDPVTDYGRWKAEAERRVLDDDGTVIRLPLLVSVDPPDHMLLRLRASADGGAPVAWFVDEIRRPARAAEVAAAIWRITGVPRPERTGCWHLTGAERLSRYDMAVRIAQGSGDRLPVVAARTPPDATRPRDLELTDRRARRAVGWNPTPI